MFWLIASILVVVLSYFLIIKPLKYWEERNVPQKSVFKLISNWIIGVVNRRPYAETLCSFYNEFPDKRYSGIFGFGKAVLLLRDPELIKQLTVKEFDHFMDHRSFIPAESEPLWASNLVFLKGEKWRQMRATLSPTFTSSKMKTMFVLISQCAEDFVKFFIKDDDKIVDVDVSDVIARYTNDVIATTAFGIKCDSLRDRENEFYLMGKEAASIFKGTLGVIKVLTFMMFPTIAKFFRLRLFSSQVVKFFSNLVKTTIKTREEQNIVRPDMINLLMEARKGKYKDEFTNLPDAGFATVDDSFEQKVTKSFTKLTDMDITAQALVFFLAGFDSVSRSIAFLMHEIAVNTNVQEQLIQEVDETLIACKGKLSYEMLANMKYLDMVLSEGQRLWPNALMFDRECVKPFAIKPENANETPVNLKVGDIVWVPVFAMHRDPQYFPEPERFDPERFNDENRSNIKPYTYMPFGSGPRSCIGSRFALLEMKILLFHILSKFELVPTEKTQIPIKLSKEIVLCSENGFHLGFKRRINISKM